MSMTITSYRIRLLITLLLTSLANISYAQEMIFSNKLQQQLSIGSNGHVVTDSLISASAMKANAVNISYSISKLTSHRITSLSVGWEQADVNNIESSSRQQAFTFRLSDVFSVFKNKSRNFFAYMGYSLSSNPSYITNAGAGNYSWNSVSTVSLQQSFLYTRSRQNIGLEVSIPVAGAIYRPRQLLGTADKKFNQVISTFYSNPSFASWHNYEAIDLSLKYQYHLNDKAAIAITYQFNYKKWEGEKAFTDRFNGFGAAFTYKPGR